MSFYNVANLILRSMTSPARRIVASSFPIYEYCMSCGILKMNSDKYEQCLECFTASSRDRKFHPSSGKQLTTQYTYKDSDKIPFSYRIDKSTISIVAPPPSPSIEETEDDSTEPAESIDPSHILYSIKIDKTKVREFPVNAGTIFPSSHSAGEVIDGHTTEILMLTFLLDCTGSMGPYIELARDKIREMMSTIVANQNKKLAEVYGGSGLFKLYSYVSIIGYRDFSDPIQFEHLLPTSDINDAIKALESIKVSGGGDIPEDILGAIALYMQSSAFPVHGTPAYQHITNALVLVADAPGHGAFMNGGCADNHANPQDEQTMIDYLNQLKMNNVDLICLQLHHSMQQTVEFLKCNYDDANYKVEHVNVSPSNAAGMAHATINATSSACYSSIARRSDVVHD